MRIDPEVVDKFESWLTWRVNKHQQVVERFHRTTRGDEETVPQQLAYARYVEASAILSQFQYVLNNGEEEDG